MICFYRIQNSFSINDVESVTVLECENELKEFKRCMTTDECGRSIFEPISLRINNNYFVLNAENLCL